MVLRSRKQETADAMVAGARASRWPSRSARGGSRSDDATRSLGRVTATDNLADLADCDLVIESVVEDLDVKKALFAELDGVVKADAILATNTSTLPVVEMAMVDRPRPTRCAASTSSTRRP